MCSFPGQLVKWFNWGPGQPSGGEQHCMYLVGGFLGYQWADFHCGFEVMPSREGAYIIHVFFYDKGHVPAIHQSLAEN